MNFAQKFLEFVKQSIVASDPNVHYIFNYDAHRKTITMSRDEETLRPLLPDWFIQSMEKPI